MPTSHRAVDTGGYLCYTRAAQARSASRRIDAGAMRKHRTGFFRFIREVKDSDMFRVSPADGIQNRGFWRRSLGTFCRWRQKVPRRRHIGSQGARCAAGHMDPAGVYGTTGGQGRPPLPMTGESVQVRDGGARAPRPTECSKKCSGSGRRGRRPLRAGYKQCRGGTMLTSSPADGVDGSWCGGWGTLSYVLSLWAGRRRSRERRAFPFQGIRG